jgi:hypothetical protein
VAEVEQFYARFGGRLPPALREQLTRLKAGVARL